MFSVVMKPKMKNSAVTVMNGTRYPGDVRAVDGLDCVVTKSVPRFLKIITR